MSRSEEDRFIGKLLEETYQEVDCVSDSSPASYEYFQEKIRGGDFNEFVDKFGMKCDFNGRTGCYRCQWNDLIFDFPRNWSFFKSLSEAKESFSVIVLDHLNDVDSLFEVFKHIDLDLLKVIVAKVGVDVIFLPVWESNLEEWTQLEAHFMAFEEAIAA